MALQTIANGGKCSKISALWLWRVFLFSTGFETQPYDDIVLMSALEHRP